MLLNIFYVPPSLHELVKWVCKQFKGASKQAWPQPIFYTHRVKWRYDSHLLWGKGRSIFIEKHILIWFFFLYFFWVVTCCWLFSLVEMFCLHKQKFFWYPNMNYKLNLEEYLLGWINKVDFRASQHSCCASGNTSQPAINLPKSRRQRLEALGSSTWGIPRLSVFLPPHFISENRPRIMWMFPSSSVLCNSQKLRNTFFWLKIPILQNREEANSLLGSTENERCLNLLFQFVFPDHLGSIWFHDFSSASSACSLLWWSQHPPLLKMVPVHAKHLELG